MSDVRVVLDDSRWRDFLANLNKKIKDPFPLLKAAAVTYGFKDIIEHFRDEQGEHRKWPARKPSTQRAYASKHKKDARYNPSNKLLQLTGHLRNSLLPSRGGIKRQDRMSVLLFSTSKVGIYHDEGTPKMAKRDFMWLSSKAQQKMVDLIIKLAVGK